MAIVQTRYYFSGKEIYLRMTKFWGKFLLISLAIGVVTGMQEFQFGMNWSQYSRYVGDIFGAPLAMEGLIAFFLESTFIGLWIFGWGRLSPRLHLLTIWLTAVGTALVGVFHPRGGCSIPSATSSTTRCTRRDRPTSSCTPPCLTS